MKNEFRTLVQDMGSSIGRLCGNTSDITPPSSPARSGETSGQIPDRSASAQQSSVQAGRGRAQIEELRNLSAPGARSRPTVRATASSTPSSAQRSLAKLDLPLGEVLGSGELIQRIVPKSGRQTPVEPIFLDGNNIKVSYDAKYKIVRAQFGNRYGPVNVQLSDDAQNVQSIGGSPPLSRGEMDYLVQSKFLHPSLPGRVAPSEPDAVMPFFSQSFSSPAAFGMQGAQRIAASPRVDNHSASFLTPADLIHPRELQGLVLNKDYVLLTHRPREESAAAIRAGGLRSLKDLAEDSNSPAAVKKRFTAISGSHTFTNDSNLIYFRPVGRRYAISKDDVVVAAKCGAVHVFDQEHRARSDGSAGSHRASAIPIADYLALEASQPPGTFLSRYKTFVPYARHQHDMDYIPEVCLDAGRIDPEFFVPHK